MECVDIFYSERNTQPADAADAACCAVLGHIHPNGHKKHSAISEAGEEHGARATQCDNVATGVACVLDQRRREGESRK